MSPLRLTCIVFLSALVLGLIACKDKPGACEARANKWCQDDRTTCSALFPALNLSWDFHSGRTCRDLGYTDNGGAGGFYMKWDPEEHTALGYSMKLPRGCTGAVTETTETLSCALPPTLPCNGPDCEKSGSPGTTSRGPVVATVRSLCGYSRSSNGPCLKSTR